MAPVAILVLALRRRRWLLGWSRFGRFAIEEINRLRHHSELGTFRLRLLLLPLIKLKPALHQDRRAFAAKLRRQFRGSCPAHGIYERCFFKTRPSSPMYVRFTASESSAVPFGELVDFG